ncbi:MAG: peroxiredoxin family protein [Thermodesulfobacteriota bacterium]
MKKLSIIPIQFLLTFAVILTLISTGQAQKIQLHFPHFAGQTYDWKIFQGEKEFTVRSGKIPPDGRMTLIMPEPYQDYRGMTRWMLKKGGGLDMIYVGKAFAVECLSAHPAPGNIIYKDNPENDYLSAQSQRQQATLKKLGAVNHLLQAYSPEDALYKTALKEQERLRLQFEQTQKERTNSALYAARFGEIVDFTRGVADQVYENREDHVRYFNDFVSHTMNFMDLYTSGHWDRVLDNWVMMNIRSKDGDAGFEKRLNIVLNRMKENKILGAFAEKVVPLLVQKGKDDLLPVIAARLNKCPQAMDELTDTTRQMISSFKILTGRKAPNLIFKAPVLTQTRKSDTDIVLETGNLNADYTILLFYKGSCALCEDALIVLANRYKWLKSHNVRVIAVSGDNSEQGFEKKRRYHQWPDNYCDFAGMDGTNFRNYAVMGIPTLYLLDKTGVVLKKSAMADEIIDRVKRERSLLHP